MELLAALLEEVWVAVEILALVLRLVHVFTVVVAATLLFVRQHFIRFGNSSEPILCLLLLLLTTAHFVGVKLHAEGNAGEKGRRVSV